MTGPTYVSNKYSGRCTVCMLAVDTYEGYCVLNEQGKWKTYCKSSQCLPRTIVKSVTRRELNAQGRIIMPYEADAITWLKKMPGGRFISKQQSQLGFPYWEVSLLPRNRKKVLEIARILQLDIAPELLTYDTSEEKNHAGEFDLTPDSLKVPIDEALVQARIDHAAAAGAYPYQLEGIRFLLEHPRCLLADEPGLGKTMISLCSILPGHGAIVVVPATVKQNWARECRRWRPDLTPRVVDGRQPALMYIPRANEVVITNYDSLPDQPPAFEEGQAPIVIIMDELHVGKNVYTKRHKSTAAWSQAVDRFVGMTGTPMTNRPPDLWGVLAVIGIAKDIFKTPGHFRNLFGAVKAGYGWEWGDPSPVVPALLRKGMLRRRQIEVLKDLPPYTRKVHILSTKLSDDMVAMLDKVYEDCLEELNAQQLPEFTRMAKVRGMLATLKIPEMHELLDEYQEADLPVVVFSAHKAPVVAAASRDGWGLITGEQSVEERQRVVDAFQAGDLRGVAATIGAGSVGITLTRAAHMLMVDQDWTPALNDQAECRIRRIGQVADHIVYTRMAWAHPLDERVEELLAWKTELHRKTFDAAADEGVQEFLRLEDERERREALAELERIKQVGYVPVVRIVEETLEDRARRTARTAAELAQQAAERLVNLRRQAASDARDAGFEERRAHFAETSLPKWKAALQAKTPAIVVNGQRDPARLKAALNLMMGVCDGAQSQDGMGFNKPDSLTAKFLCYLDLKSSPDAAETVALLLFKYRRQLATAGFGDLFDTKEVTHA